MLGRVSIFLVCFVSMNLHAASSLETIKTSMSNALVSACKDAAQEQKKIIYSALDQLNSFYSVSKGFRDELEKTKAELEKTKGELKALRESLLKLRSAPPQEPAREQVQPASIPQAPQEPAKV